MPGKSKPFICSAETVFDGQVRGLHADGMYADITEAARDFAMRLARYVPFGARLNVQYANARDEPVTVVPQREPPPPPSWPPIRAGRELEFGIPFTLPELRLLLSKMDKGVRTKQGECCRCHQRDELFWYEGRIYCGDCRYYMRHGVWPTFGRRPTSWCMEVTRVGYRDSFGSETLHRFRHTKVPSVKYARMLLDIEQSCRTD